MKIHYLKHTFYIRKSSETLFVLPLDLVVDYFDCGFFLLRGAELSALQIHSDTDLFEAILTTQILPLLSSLTRVTLHGGVFVQNDKAAIYLGEEGAGKSTLTTYLHQQGSVIYSDDVAALDFDTEFHVYPGLPEIRINDDSCQKLFTEHQLGKLPHRLSKRQILISQKISSRASISALFLLSPQKEGLKKQSSYLSSAQRFQALIEHQFRWDIWNAKILKNEFNLISTLCETVPFYHLEYPMAYESLPWITQQLERSLHGSPNESPCLR